MPDFQAISTTGMFINNKMIDDLFQFFSPDSFYNKVSIAENSVEEKER